MMHMTDEVLIIDGTALLFRSFFGGVSVRAPDGTEVGAVMLSCNKLGQLVSRFSPKHIAVVFDAGQRTFRNDIEPGYKANRGSPPPELVPQFELLRSASEALGFASFSRVGYEADDLIATYAALGEAAGTRSSRRKRSLVHHLCVGDLGWVADAPEVPSSYRHKRLTHRCPR